MGLEEKKKAICFSSRCCEVWQEDAASFYRIQTPEKLSMVYKIEFDDAT